MSEQEERKPSLDAFQSSGLTDEQAIRCAVDQATLDMPSIEVTDASLFRKLDADDTDERWYVEVDLRHLGDDTIAMALYRVWRSTEGLKAIQVTIVWDA
jgi:hypothetical protein